ncbi:MAG: SprB repeat-containing protein [Saprospiraceae bacterium]
MSIAFHSLMYSFTIGPEASSQAEPDFRDGAKSNDKDPLHHFASEGSLHEVCLDVENECGPVRICRNITVGNIQSLALASWEIHPVTCYEGHDGSIKLTIQGGVPPLIRSFGTMDWFSKEIFDLVAGKLFC